MHFICFCYLWLQSWQPVSQHVHPDFLAYPLIGRSRNSLLNSLLSPQVNRKIYYLNSALQFNNIFLRFTSYLARKKFLANNIIHFLACLRVCLHLLSVSACTTTTPTNKFTNYTIFLIKLCFSPYTAAAIEWSPRCPQFH